MMNEENQNKMSETIDRMDQEKGEEEEEYYYYYDEETSMPPISESVEEEENGQEDEEYYYYYDKEPSMPPTIESVEEEEEIDYYYYYYDNGTKKDDIISDSDSSSPSSSPTVLPTTGQKDGTSLDGLDDEYYYYYEDSNAPSLTPSLTPSEEYYYYYEDSNTPSVTPSEEEYYYYYEDSNTPSLTPTEEDFYYYYYDSKAPSVAPSQEDDNYEQNDKSHSNGPSLNPPATDSPSPQIIIQPTKQNNRLERGCHDYLFSPSLKDVYTEDVSFAFTIESTSSLKNKVIIAETIIKDISASILTCKTQEKMSKGKKGIFLIHFPVKETLHEVSNCTPAFDNTNSCLILSGKLIINSNQLIESKEKNDALMVLKHTIDNLSDMDTLKGEVFFSQYLGPTIHVQESHKGDQIVVSITILMSILIIIFATIWYRGNNRRKYRRVTFASTVA